MIGMVVVWCCCNRGWSSGREERWKESFSGLFLCVADPDSKSIGVLIPAWKMVRISLLRIPVHEWSIQIFVHFIFHSTQANTSNNTKTKDTHHSSITQTNQQNSTTNLKQLAILNCKAKKDNIAKSLASQIPTSSLEERNTFNHEYQKRSHHTLPWILLAPLRHNRTDLLLQTQRRIQP